MPIKFKPLIRMVISLFAFAGTAVCSQSAANQRLTIATVDARGANSVDDKPIVGQEAPKPGDGTGTAIQWRTWEDQQCKPRNTGNAGRFRPSYAKFKYTLQEAPDGAKAALPYILIPALANPSVLYAGQELVVEVFGPRAKDSKLGSPIMDLETKVPLLDVEIDITKGQAYNPAPVRPSSGSVTPSFVPKPKESSDLYSCAYKQQLVGDAIPGLTVTAILNGEKTPVQLLQTSLPQAHTLSYFNIATGLVASNIRDSTFTRVQTAAASGSTPAQYATKSAKDDPSVAPALFFTAYVFRPIDAEGSFEWKDMIPEPSIGFSLTSPADNFYFGGSSEFFVRNVQLVYGFHYGKTTSLVAGAFDDPSSKDALPTQKTFSKGGFVGLTFNIDFIKGLFTGGK